MFLDKNDTDFIEYVCSPDTNETSITSYYNKRIFIVVIEGING